MAYLFYLVYPATRPSRISTIRCAAVATSRLWVTMTMVVRCFSPMSRKSFTTQRAGLGIEIAGRLVRQQNARLHQQRPRERRPLHLAAGKLVQPVPRAMLHADGGEQFRAAALDFLRRLILQQAGQAHVFLHRQRRQQVEKLENETDFRPAQTGQTPPRRGDGSARHRGKSRRWSGRRVRRAHGAACSCRSRSAP